MLVSYTELEKMTDLFTLGAYFLFMVYGSSIMFRMRRHHLQRVTGWVLAYWAFLVFDGFIGYLFDVTTSEGAAMSLKYDRFATVLDMTAAVGCVMIGYAITYTRKVYHGIVFLHSLPFIFFLSMVAYTGSDTWMMVAFAYTIAYSVFYILYFSVQIRSYISRVHAVYSDDSSRNLGWLKVLCWVFFGMLFVWAIPAYLHSVGTYVLFYVSSIVLWWIAIHKIMRQQPVNIRYNISSKSEGEIEESDEDDDMNNRLKGIASAGVVDAEKDIVDRRFAFAPRMERMFEEEKIYLQTDLNINELARLLGTNRAYLSAYLNNVKHVSFFDYVNSWRLRRSITLLNQSNETIDQVSEYSGFNNAYSYRRVFVKAYGCTPTEWRRLSEDERIVRIKAFEEHPFAEDE